MPKFPVRFPAKFWRKAKFGQLEWIRAHSGFWALGVDTSTLRIFDITAVQKELNSFYSHTPQQFLFHNTLFQFINTSWLHSASSQMLQDSSMLFLQKNSMSLLVFLLILHIDICIAINTDDCDTWKFWWPSKLIGSIKIVEIIAKRMGFHFNLLMLLRKTCISLLSRKVIVVKKFVVQKLHCS